MAEYIVTDEQLANLSLQIQNGHRYITFEHGEPIVRCKDCHYCKPYEAMKVEGYKCTRVPTCFCIDLDGFCAWGEPITVSGGDDWAVR